MLLSNRYNISRFRVGLPVSWAPDFLPAVGGYYTNLSHRPKLAPAKSAPPTRGGLGQGAQLAKYLRLENLPACLICTYTRRGSVTRPGALTGMSPEA